MGGKSGGDPKMQVTRYHASVHYGVCAGPVDSVETIYYGEKPLVTERIEENSIQAVDEPELHGGVRVEGGFVGAIEVALGGPGQTIGPGLARSLARNEAATTTDPAHLPGFRGILSFFIGGEIPIEVSEGVDPWRMLLQDHGADIGHNMAIIKSFWVKVRRAPKLVPFPSTIVVEGMHLANPAAIIWECLTNREWGMGGAPSTLDPGSFASAADTLAAEGFGLAMLWSRQETIEDFVGDVLGHIDATLALDPFTGRFRLKLIRDDYDPETLDEINPSNAAMVRFERRGWGEITNEINVVWTNPENEQQETVTVHDTAQIASLGGALVSETRDYYGIRTSELALRVATRDLRAVSSALASCQLTVNRSAWRLVPGDVVALRWPLYGIDRLIMRVAHIDYGAPGNSEITVSLMEDVFGMPEEAIGQSDGSAWVPTTSPPVPLAYPAAVSLPYYLLAQAVGDAEAQAVDTLSDKELVFAAHNNERIQQFDVARYRVPLEGDPFWQEGPTVRTAGYATLAGPLPAEVTSTLPAFGSVVMPGNFFPGAVLWFGPADETGELVSVRDWTPEDGYVLRRGLLDTTPRAWPHGTPVWGLLPESLGYASTEEHLAGETLTLRLLSRTTSGRLDVDAAPDLPVTLDGRMHRPYRPGNLRVNGALALGAPSSDYPLLLEWSGRNRLTETTVLTRWDDGHTAPEPGTTYRVEAVALDDTGEVLETTVLVTTGDHQHTVQESDLPAAFAAADAVEIRVYSVRDYLDSWQPAVALVPTPEVVLIAPEIIDVLPEEE